MQVTFMNVISPLAELEAQQFPLVQSCVFPKLVCTSDDVRKASAEAERKIDAHMLSCRFHFFTLFSYLYSISWWGELLIIADTIISFLH